MFTAETLKRVVMTIALPVPFIAACATTPAPSNASAPQSSSADLRHADTKAEAGNCDYYNYCDDESKNADDCVGRVARLRPSSPHA